MFSHINFGACLLLFLFQLVPMIYFAKKLGIDDVAVMLDKLGGIISEKFNSKKSGGDE